MIKHLRITCHIKRLFFNVLHLASIRNGLLGHHSGVDRGAEFGLSLGACRNRISEAGVAQRPEQMIRNHQVVGSTPIPGSRFHLTFQMLTPPSDGGSSSSR
jgi:hypothetical protein